MTAFGRQILIKAAKLCDLAVMVWSFGLASVLVLYGTPGFSLGDLLSMRVRVKNFALFAGFLLAWHTIFCMFGLYESRRLAVRKAEVLDVIKATSLAVAIVCAAKLIGRLEMVTPVFLAIFWFISAATVVSSRLTIRYILERVRVRGRNLREMVIIGTNHRAIRFARNIQAKPALGCRVLGFVDQDWHGMETFRQTGYPLACDLERFPCLLRERAIDEVVIALPMKSLYLEASRIVALSNEQGIVVGLLNNPFNLTLLSSKAEEIEDTSITLCSNSTENWPHLVKRTLDVSLSLVATVVFAPLFVVTAILVKLTSPGPIFFMQERVGLNKRRFRMCKFRTMVQDAEQRMDEIEHLNEVSGPVFKIKKDPRITPIGRILRAASIDELPQLFNVLKSDMSLVGPRPLPVRDYEGFDQDWKRRRFSVRPGITCLWQINGRSTTPFEEWMKLDMQYIDQWSLWLDLKILAMTVPAVLKGAGAS
jgi:exopolysaccharide biosynthesis polyprenyl glycosylphosphotransferase